MSSAPSSESHWLCPTCDTESTTVATDGMCPTCGSRLIEIRARAEDLTGVVVDGRFEIRGLLGQGGMGAVYRAWQRSVGREVAIKIIEERHGRDPMSVRRFLREARLASQLSQPNTVSVLDFGQAADGRLFIAMELVRGRTLAEVLAAEGPFPPSRAAWVGVQLCDALDAAHRLQIVHRDLKPANVVLLDDPPGRDLIKVLDFGLAKSLAESETKATDTGLVVGTPRYMAPEMILGERPTAQSDLYAVGVILGELATGKLMWDATSFPALAGQKLQGSPIIHELPLGLRGVVARLIDPDIARRPSTAGEVRAMLRPVVAEHEDSAPMPALTTGQVDGEPRRTTAPPITPGGARTPSIPPVDPTLPQATAPGTRAAILAADDGGERPGSGPRAIAATVEVAAATPAPTSSIRPAVAAAERSTEDLSVVQPAASRRGLLIGGLAAVAAAVVVVVLLMRGGGDEAARPAGGSGSGSPSPAGAVDAAVAAVPLDAAEAPAALIDAAAAVTPAVTITFDIRSKPAGGEITIDGQVVGTTPAVVPWPRGDAPVTITIQSGRLGARTKATPDQDRTFNLTLRAPGGPDKLPF